MMTRFGNPGMTVLALALAGCTGCAGDHRVKEMDRIAESYVTLVLAVGEHDPDYVDAYYGPGEWREEARRRKKPLDQILDEARPLLAALNGLDFSGAEEMLSLRHRYLQKQLGALATRVEHLQGRRLSFDEEARALYDVSPQPLPESHFDEILASLDALVPGGGPLPERYGEYRRDFIVPADKLDAVFRAAIDEARRRTRERILLPENESFSLEYVTGKSWSAYNWYKGNYASLIQLNTDLPVYIDSALDLACHEGYPGHHVYNVLLEKNLVAERGWVEFSVYPLFSPQSLIAEGTANFGIEVVFPPRERLAFARRVLFPLAGLDPGRAERFFMVMDLVSRLSHAGNEAARRYLDGEIGRDEAAEWLHRRSLMSMERALQRMRFIEQYRSYVINYNLGQDIVKAYVEARGGTADRPDRRWEEFAKLISTPRVPSALQE